MDLKDLKDKVVVVTGGAQGIGYEIADHYLAEGVKVATILDLNEEKGEIAVKNLAKKYGNGKAVFIKCDVTKDLEEVSKKILDNYKKVDVLVNNAGVVNESSARKTIELNTIALIEWSMKFWEHMRIDKGGQGGTIVNIGSIYSYIVDPYVVFYKASKFAVMGFTRALGHSENFSKFGVRVLVICPGFTATSLTDNQLCWDEHVYDFDKFTKKEAWQDADRVGQAAVDVFKRGESGSAWRILGGEVAEILLVAEDDKLRK